MDITADDVKEALAEAGLRATNAWRIRSKATNQETRLYRITTTCQTTLDTLLTRGLRMFHHSYSAEPSNTPKPQPIQCGRCLQFDHPTSSCQERRPTCGICGGDHAASACKSQDVTKCGNCGGDHVAFSTRCPARPSEAATPATAAPIKSADAPLPAEIPKLNNPQTHSMIRFFIQSLINLLPNQRDQIQRVIRPLIHKFFGLQVAMSYSGSWLHVSLV